VEGIFKKKEKELEELGYDEAISEKRRSIAEKKRAERDFRKREGRDWKKVLGVVKAIKPNRESIHDLYGMGGGGESSLRDMSKPDKLRRL